jgi:hypothetical protein
MSTDDLGPRRDLEALVRTVAAAWPGWERAAIGQPCRGVSWGFVVGVLRDGTLVPRRLHDHPGRALQGFSAPPAWRAVAVAVHGTARRLDERSSSTGDDHDGRAAVVWLCNRDGATASWLSLPGGPPMVTVTAGRTHGERDPAGRDRRGPAADDPDPGPNTRGVVAGLLRRAMRAPGDAS